MADSTRYQLFCRVACAALLLIGFALLAYSYQVSRFACRRSDGQCTISHIGVLAGSETTVSLQDITLIHREGSSGPTIDVPTYYRIWVNSRFESTPFNYAWLSGSDYIDGTLREIRTFVEDSSIPDIEVRMLDPRLDHGIIGVFLLITGIAYTLANRRVIFSDSYPAANLKSLKDVTETDASSELNAPRTNEETPSKETKSYSRSITWFQWLMIPSLLLAITYSFSLIVIFVPITTSHSFLSKYNLELSLIVMSILVSLVFFASQAWIVNRCKISGLRWLLYSMCSLVILPLIGFLLIKIPVPAQLRGICHIGLWLIVGLIVGILQRPVLNRRLAHASWWILGSSLAGLCVDLAIVLQNELERSYFIPYGWMLEPFILAAAFSAITGLVLIWLPVKAKSQILTQ